MASLSRALKRDGSVSAENEFQDFVGGFNQAKFFDFVDVGTIKENAISKLKGMYPPISFDIFSIYLE